MKIVNYQLSIVNLQLIVISKGRTIIIVTVCFRVDTYFLIFLYMDTNYTNFKFIDYPNVNVIINGTLLAMVSRINFLVQTYHGCDRVNTNGTRKLIDYQGGESCLLATNEECWRRTKAKYLIKKTYLTHQRQRYLKCSKNFYFINGSQ